MEWQTCPQCNRPTATWSGREIHCPKCDGPLRREHFMHEEDPTVTTIRQMDRAGVNVRRFFSATLASFDPEPDFAALEAATWYVKEFADAEGAMFPDIPWLFLYGAGSTNKKTGKVGNGKTHLGVAIARELIGRGLIDPDSYRFVTAETLLLEIEGSYKSDSGSSVLGLLNRYARLELLHIDDFGVRDPSPHAARIFDELTKRREARATIWTSNLSPAVLGALWGPRVASRIIGETRAGKWSVELTGRDRRLS